MARRQRRMILLEATTRRSDARAPQLGTTGERRASFPRAGIPGLALLVALGGCMSLTSEGKIGDREVHLDGTGFAWLDENVYRAEGDALVLSKRDSDDVRLHMYFTSAVFDPTIDLRSLPPAERERLYDELEFGDSLVMTIARGDRLLAGDALSFVRGARDVPEAAPYLLDVTLSVGSPPLERGAEYPAVVERLAEGAEAELQLREVEPRLVGDLDLHLRRSGKDDDGVEGDVELRFDIERVPERIAECNFQRSASEDGSVDACDPLQLTNE